MPGPGALGPGMPRGRARRRHLPDHRRTVGVNDPDSVTAGTAGKQPVPPRPGRACCRGAGRKDRPAPPAPSRRPRPGRRALRSADEGEPACPESWLPGPARVRPGSGAAVGPVSPRGHRRLSRPDLAHGPGRPALPSLLLVVRPSGWRARAVPRARCFHGTLAAWRSSMVPMGRGVVAAPVLGAAGALIGSRFRTAVEALAVPSASQAVGGCGQGAGRSSGVLDLDIARGTSSAAGIRLCTGGSLRGREGARRVVALRSAGCSRRAVGPGSWSKPARLPGPVLRPSEVPRRALSPSGVPRGVLRVLGARLSGACFCRWGWIVAGGGVGELSRYSRSPGVPIVYCFGGDFKGCGGRACSVLVCDIDGACGWYVMVRVSGLTVTTACARGGGR